MDTSYKTSYGRESAGGCTRETPTIAGQDGEPDDEVKPEDVRSHVVRAPDRDNRDDGDTGNRLLYTGLGYVMGYINGIRPSIVYIPSYITRPQPADNIIQGIGTCMLTLSCLYYLKKWPFTPGTTTSH